MNSRNFLDFFDYLCYNFKKQIETNSKGVKNNMQKEVVKDKKVFRFHVDSEIVNIGKQTMKKHCHDTYEIYYITKGTCCHFIENMAFHLMPGDIIIIPPGVMHNTEYHNTVHSRMLINCSHHYIPQSTLESISSIPFLYRNPEIIDIIDDIFNKIDHEYMDGDEMSDGVLMCYAHLLFYNIARNPNMGPPTDENKHYIDDAIEFIQSHFTTHITLADLANRYFISTEHFSRIFKKKTGFNFNEYINILRLQKAESLLKQLSAAPITQIAAQSGFNDSNYFSLKFKELYGVSPKKFQTMNK